MGGIRAGAGEGNRTLVISLEGFCSTIELHPPSVYEIPSPMSAAEAPCQLGGGGWIRTNVGAGQQIYSLPPLAARAPLRRNLKLCEFSGGWSRILRPIPHWGLQRSQGRQSAV